MKPKRLHREIMQYVLVQLLEVERDGILVYSCPLSIGVYDRCDCAFDAGVGGHTQFYYIVCDKPSGWQEWARRWMPAWLYCRRYHASNGHECFLPYVDLKELNVMNRAELEQMIRRDFPSSSSLSPLPLKSIRIAA
jgi:hypothetical protein